MWFLICLQPGRLYNVSLFYVVEKTHQAIFNHEYFFLLLLNADRIDKRKCLAYAKVNGVVVDGGTFVCVCVCEGFYPEFDYTPTAAYKTVWEFERKWKWKKEWEKTKTHKLYFVFVFFAFWWTFSWRFISSSLSLNILVRLVWCCCGFCSCCFPDSLIYIPVLLGSFVCWVGCF